MSLIEFHQHSRTGTYRMAKRRRKPMDPAEIARIAAESRRDPSKWGLAVENLNLEANENVSVQGETRTKVTRARRFDVFQLFHARDPDAITEGVLNSVRRLQDDIAIRHGTAGSPLAGVGPTGDPEPRNGLMEAQIKAGRRIDDVGARTGAHSFRILMALSEPEVIHGQQVNWHKVVQSATGEADPRARAALVRSAMKNLSDAYSIIDNGAMRLRA